VIGIDISKKEIVHAQERAKQREANCMFVWGDMENAPLPDNEIDCVISNGAFCLAPNKEKALSEVYRVLRPGGRMSLYMSTIVMPLEAGVSWPICMRMFAEKSSL
jgi:ubiquinone/menaquinone biosynthesis C-methylase UbiE